MLLFPFHVYSSYLYKRYFLFLLWRFFFLFLRFFVSSSCLCIFLLVERATDALLRSSSFLPSNLSFFCCSFLSISCLFKSRISSNLLDFSNLLSLTWSYLSFIDLTSLFIVNVSLSSTNFLPFFPRLALTPGTIALFNVGIFNWSSLYSFPF